MYKEITGGSYEDVEDGIGGFFRCWIPPQPPIHKIDGFDLPQDEQFWRRTELPRIKGRDIETFDGSDLEPEVLYKWDVAARQEEIKITGFDPSAVDSKGQFKAVAGVEKDPGYVNPILQRFRMQEWAKRRKGYWFMNNGKPTYLTGSCYMYLNYTHLEAGYPTYFSLSRQNFYVLEHAWLNPKSLGNLEIGSRGYGKSTEKVAFMLDKMTQPYNWRGERANRLKAAIQSKTEDDAKIKQFQNKLVPMFNRYPEFFKPKFNHGSNPKNTLSFFRETIKGRTAKNVTFNEDDELGNTIIAVDAQVGAIDGDTYTVVFCDEVGKVDPSVANVFQRHMTNREAVYRSAVGKTGIILNATTVEEMEKAGGKECKEMWDASGKVEDGGNGFTVTGLSRRFIPCYKCAFDKDLGFLDKFGDVDEVKSKLYFEAELLKAKRQGLEAYLKRLRMYPMKIEDCFISPNSASPFNIYIINERLREIADGLDLFKFRFEWDDNKRFSTVRAAPDPNGGWSASWLKMDGKSNLVQQGMPLFKDGRTVKTYEPLNNARFRIGMDPIDHKATVDGKASKPVIMVKRLFDPNADRVHDKFTLEDCGMDEKHYRLGKAKWTSNKYVAWFDKRLDDPNDISEQALMACWFFGTQIHIENNKRSTINYFNDHGCQAFIQWRTEQTFTQTNGRQFTEGTPGVDPVIDMYINMVATYVTHYGHLIDSKELLEDLRDFERAKIRFHDYTVSMGMTELATLAQIIEVQEPIDIRDIFRTYDNRGLQSERVGKQIHIDHNSNRYGT
jgi:hypothetical protein